MIDRRPMRKRRRKRLTIGKVRTGLYKTARALGDVQAVRRGRVGRRIGRRLLGKLTGRLFGRLFK